MSIVIKMWNIVSFFSGCGGLDLGFEQAGFHVLWANDIDPVVTNTYIHNHPNSKFNLRDLRSIDPYEIPECDGFIGGPPCQSWSIAGEQKGLDDARGKLFLTYINLISLKRPKFFLIENVKGLLDDKFKNIFSEFLARLIDAGYNVYWNLVDAVNYGVPQNRMRVFIVGIRKDLNITYHFPQSIIEKFTIANTISDIQVLPKSYHKGELVQTNLECPNHDLIDTPFGDYYIKGNRRRSWTMPSFTIHATAANIPLHPSSPKMVYSGFQNWEFQKDKLNEYRRFSVRECARLQTFPDSYQFFYDDITNGYKMVGNAVPPLLAKVLALSIKDVLEETNEQNRSNTFDKNSSVLVGYCRGLLQLNKTIEHLLYYVRSDMRTGSFFVKPCFTPHYLLLHYGVNALLFELENDKPFRVNAAYLKKLNFNVSGYYYLCFRLKNKKPINCERLINKKALYLNHNSNRYAPFFTTLNEVLK